MNLMEPMEAETLKRLTEQWNGRTLYPELEGCFAQYAKDLHTMMDGVLKASRSFPLDLEPAPIFTPEVR
ncbi:hypothetical protein [Paenibacillus piri]|uniref:Uncharacterized protein n=1 Tax=Paenibacillus piri TaxID=2547395 RepID=A0A4R5KBR2_9BACL|nr:hypothetical protein [Paenibacillus piri]TDF92516.1 hypothetical protein E1757_29445 [Paenibacillus piri]